MQIYTAKKLTLQLLLEQPSPNADVESPSSLTQAFDLGYDMVAECNVESILNPSRHESRDDINFQNRIEVNLHKKIYHWYFVFVLFLRIFCTLSTKTVMLLLFRKWATYQKTLCKYMITMNCIIPHPVF